MELSVVIQALDLKIFHNFCSFMLLLDRPLRSVVRRIAICAECLEFDSRAGQIGSNFAKSLPPLRCFFGAVLLSR